MFFTSSFSICSSSDPSTTTLDYVNDHHIPLLKEVANLDLRRADRAHIPPHIRRNISRPTRSLVGNYIWTSVAPQVYLHPAWPGGDVMDGGGPLALTTDSVKKFCLKLYTLIAHSLPSLKEIKIYWVSLEF